jgi:lysophospholipase L1-like esterase
MNLNDLFQKNEKPLDRLPEDGGFAGIFRTICCVGDSLSSGEFQVPLETGGWSYYDMYEYSWGQFMARTIGAKVYNFSRGGMTAKWYLETYADENGLWDKNKKAQAYIIALGVNDILNDNMPIGSVEDVKDDYKENEKTFAGQYGAIVQRYKAISPDAKFFFVTMPRECPDWGPENGRADHRKLMYDFAEKFDNSYVIDLFEYAPCFDEDFKKKFFLNGHMNPLGYALFGKMITSYLDFIIRHNVEDFNLIGFAGK